jgi:tetratricopeptide (TPR) repeat protein
VYTNVGRQARAQGQYAKALKFLLYALEEAQRDNPTDMGVAISLLDLAELYRIQGDYARAEPLYKRSLAVDEKNLGPDHVAIATTLENYALLLSATNRQAEAKELEERAAAIRKANW